MIRSLSLGKENSLNRDCNHTNRAGSYIVVTGWLEIIDRLLWYCQLSFVWWFSFVFEVVGGQRLD
jgi:hypothetical protein